VAGRVAYAVWLLPLAALREDRRLRAAALASPPTPSSRACRSRRPPSMPSR